MQNASETSHQPPANGQRPPKILITEDEYIVALDLKLRLNRLGFEVAGIAASGDDAILQNQTARPDLILMDIQLYGDMDGIEAARQIRSASDVPIIFLTANTDHASMERATSTYAFSYLLKPFKESELKFSIQMALEHSRTARLLREAQEQLEERVRARTAELVESYTTLQNECELHRRTLEQLQAAQIVAQQADKTKNEFLATISHELLTPMNGILGMVNLMLESNQTGPQYEQLSIVKASADDLLELIQGLLDFSRMQNGTIECMPVTFSIREQIASYVSPLALRAREKSLFLECQIDDNVPDVIVTDPNRIGQILVNLADNAIKFTDRGGVTINVSRLREEGNRVQLRFSIQDTGIGVPLDKQKLIFEPFVQADGSHSRRHEGVGLGLSIASRLVNILGGKIDMESQPGSGSIFRFELWAELPELPSLTTSCL
ncbi:MAG: ATP-binding protein [Nibricoccus sp.]